VQISRVSVWALGDVVATGTAATPGGGGHVDRAGVTKRLTLRLRSLQLAACVWMGYTEGNILMDGITGYW
jgi:hypothetical protein